MSDSQPQSVLASVVCDARTIAAVETREIVESGGPILKTRT